MNGNVNIALFGTSMGEQHGRVRLMESNAFKSMSTDELWRLHEQVTSTLAHKIAEEKAKLEERLRRRLEIAHSAIGPIGSAVPIRRFFRNIRTQKIPPRHGPAVESNRIG
jgi:hypothetical protein